MTEALDPRLVKLIRDARKIYLFTGAGISTASGIPDYRGPRGVWNRRQPVYYEEFMTSPAARIEYWEFKLEGWDQHGNARPNPVHEASCKLERAGKLLILVTQNIDGLHGAAGTSSGKLVELHGTDSAIECQGCGERSEPAPHFERFRRTHRPPACGECNGYLKPATISFGQSLRESDLARAAAATEQADLVISLGSTLSVQPAALFPLTVARGGVPYVIVNRGSTDHDAETSVTLRLEGDVGQIFPSAVDAALADA